MKKHNFFEAPDWLDTRGLDWTFLFHFPVDAPHNTLLLHRVSHESLHTIHPHIPPVWWGNGRQQSSCRFRQKYPAMVFSSQSTDLHQWWATDLTLWCCKALYYMRADMSITFCFISRSLKNVSQSLWNTHRPPDTVTHKPTLQWNHLKELGHSS